MGLNQVLIVGLRFESLMWQKTNQPHSSTGFLRSLGSDGQVSHILGL